MENQSLQKYRDPEYELQMVGEKKTIVISQKERDAIVDAVSSGGKFVEIREYFIMSASIKWIFPISPKKDIPKVCQVCNGKEWVVGEFDEKKQVFTKINCPNCQN